MNASLGRFTSVTLASLLVVVGSCNGAETRKSSEAQVARDGTGRGTSRVVREAYVPDWAQAIPRSIPVPAPHDPAEAVFTLVRADTWMDFPELSVHVYADGYFTIDGDEWLGHGDGSVPDGMVAKIVQDVETYGMFEFDPILHIETSPYPDLHLTIQAAGRKATITYTPVLDSYRLELARARSDHFAWEVTVTHLIGQRVLDAVCLR